MRLCPIFILNKSDQLTETTTSRPAGLSARRAGIFLLLTAVASVAMVYARVSADTDQPTLPESLVAIAANKAMYNLSGAARLVSGITLIAGAWFLFKSRLLREGPGAPVIPYLFAASGAFTAVSGVCALALAASASSEWQIASLSSVEASTEAVANLRWLTGKIGFAAAGSALVAAGWRQWKAGGSLMRIAPASAVIGVAMQFIWVDAATIMHRISGAAFFVWLVVIGVMLATGRAERRSTPT